MNKKLTLILALGSMTTMLACADETTSDKSCIADATQCSESGIPQKCVDGEWVDQAACTGTQKCNKGVCSEPGSSGTCFEGAKQCSPQGMPQACSNGTWVDQAACPGDKKCQDGNCIIIPPQTCATGAKQCKDLQTPQTCDPNTNKWVDQDACGSSEKCLKGSCVDKDTAECQGKAKKCDNNGVPVTCENQMWVTGDACGDGMKCLNGDCVDESTPECKIDRKKCSESGVPMICENNAWVTLDPCGSSEKCVKGECKDNSSQKDYCDGVTCDNESTCINGVCVLDAFIVMGVGKECTNDSFGEYCDNDGNAVLCVRDPETRRWVKYVSPCSNGCIVSTIQNDTGDAYYAACIDDEINEMSPLCDAPGDKIYYCVNDQYGSYTSNYICAEGINGDIPLVANNMAYYGQYSDCGKGIVCDASMEVCANEAEADCKADTCKAKTGNSYQGNACIPLKNSDKSRCGCSGNADCNNGYTCNTKENRCVSSGSSSNPSEFTLTFPKSNTCDSFKEVNDLTKCTQDSGNKYHYTLNFNAGFVAEIVASSIANGYGGIKEPTDTMAYGIDFASVPTASNIQVEWKLGSTKLDQNQLKITDSTSKTQSYTATAQDVDKTDTFEMSGDASEFSVQHAGGPNVISIKRVTIKTSGGNAPSEDCTPADCMKSSEYQGNACVDGFGGKMCGCDSNSDCKAGYRCNEIVGLCAQSSTNACDPDNCAKAGAEEYAGNACIDDGVGGKMCGCGKDAECNTGYTCKANSCVKVQDSSSCKDADCAAATSGKYIGEKCVKDGNDQISCGCTSNSECKDGYRCVVAYMYCTKDESNTCDAGKCAAMNSYSYYGNACIDNGYGGKMCGCTKDSECKDGYKCDTTYKVCELENNCTNAACKAVPDDSYKGNVCINGYGDQKECGCNSNSDCKSGYRCNTTMNWCVKESSSTCDASKCEAMSGDDYYGNACVDNGTGGKMCGCTKKSQCKDGYTCNTSASACEIPCTNTKCKAMTGDDYTGNVCVDGYNSNKMCGCNSDSDCKSGYHCNATMLMCVEDGYVCSPSECAATTGDLYFGDACVDDGFGEKMCGCMKNADCKSGYTCNTKTDTCEKPKCTNTNCKAMTGDDYVGNICVDGYDGDQTCGCKADSDCKSGYHCNATMMMCVENGYVCSPSECAATTGDMYFGNACVDDGFGEKMCGCTKSSDCKSGYTCNTNTDTCEKPKCTNAKCNAMTGDDYAGNVCVYGYDEEMVCGCNSGTDCKSGYRCNTAMLICVKDSSTTCTTSACSAMTGDSYYGNACVDNGIGGKMCGCTKNSDCKSGYTCNTNAYSCEAEPTCTNAQCKAMTGNAYAGNVCVNGYDGDKTCGCNSNSDCKSGYRCNITMMICLEDGGDSCTTSACSAMTGDSYYGNACVDNGMGGKMCGCTKNTECKSGYICNTSTKTCAIKCTATKCKAMTGDDYAGNVCVEGYYGEQQCGCTSNSDCKSGYRCNATMMTCLKDEASCNATECKAATGIYYFGNACIDDGFGDKMCGCTSLSECNTGYKCDFDEYTCVKTTCEINSDCSYGYICDNHSCIKNTCSKASDCAAGYICSNNICIKEGACSSDSDCISGYFCDHGTCTEQGDAPGCKSDSECVAGYVCDNGTCVKASESNPVKITFTNGATCEKIMAKSTGISKCECTDTTDTCSTNKYKKLAITFDNGIVMDITSSTQLYSAKYVSLKKGGPQIVISNMKKLSTVDFTMSLGVSGQSKVSSNPLLITDGNNNQQQIFGDSNAAVDTKLSRQYKLTGSAQKITMAHDPNSANDNPIAIHDIQITAP